MMGKKKLSTIRQELKGAIKATGQDPIEWLEKRTAEAKQQGGRHGSTAVVAARLDGRRQAKKPQAAHERG